VQHGEEISQHSKITSIIFENNTCNGDVFLQHCNIEIYFYNIDMKHLQHPLKPSETPKTYTYNMQAVEASFSVTPFSSSVAPFSSSLRPWRPPQPWRAACRGRGRSNITNIQLQHHKITVETK
jgi:hypothetical protein